MSYPPNPLDSILPETGRGVVSLIGAGGKTSVMFHLARYLADQGRRVLTTTSTKILFPTPQQSKWVLVHPDPDIVRRKALDHPERLHLTAASSHLPQGKLLGYSPETIDRLAASGVFDWILVEADGSARRSLKAPAAHEPVVPAATTAVVAVAGLHALGSPLTEDTVFRSDLAAERMGLREGESVTEEALACLFVHPLGTFKGAPASARRFLLLNQVDSAAQLRSAEAVAGLLRQLPTPPAESLLATQGREILRIRACHCLEDS